MARDSSGGQRGKGQGDCIARDAAGGPRTPHVAPPPAALLLLLLLLLLEPPPPLPTSPPPPHSAPQHLLPRLADSSTSSTVMSCISRRMHRYSPRAAVKIKAHTSVTHQVPLVGATPSVQHATPCRKYSVKEKSTAFLERSTTTGMPAAVANAAENRPPMRHQPAEENTVRLPPSSRLGALKGASNTTDSANTLAQRDAKNKACMHTI